MINRKLHINEKYFLFIKFFSMLTIFFLAYLLFAFFYSIVFKIGETNDYIIYLFALISFFKCFIEYKKMLSNKFFHKDTISLKIKKVHKFMIKKILSFISFFSFLNFLYAADVVNYLS